MTADSFDLSGLVDEYRDEARRQLDLLDSVLLKLEESGVLTEDERSGLLRSLHTLKGNSGMLGLTPIVEQVHSVEALFKARPGGLPQPQLDSLFEIAALLRRAVERAGTDQAEEAFRRLAAADVEVGEAPPEEEAAAPADPAAAEEPSQQPSAEEPELEGTGGVLRVPFAKLDALLNQVGELLGAGVALEEWVRRAAPQLESVGLRRPLRERVEDLALISDELRAATMDLRMVPVRRVFSRFPSLARDLAHQQGKRVRVVLEGEDVQLDKSTVDALGEPLLHLVRNAVDHGLQRPAEREAAGRPPVGTLTLRAAQRGDQVQIEVEDDGAGLDRAAVLRQARSQGLVLPDESLDPDEVAELIFRPGFSTRREATTLSGRGIGMDVVSRSVQQLRGSLSVESPAEGGTRFVMRLPLTLAVVPAVLFETDGETFALPASEVEETVRRVPLERAGGTEVVRYRGELLPVARAASLFGWAPPGVPRGAPSAAPFALVVRRGARSAALLADRLLEQRDVVVRAIPTILGTPAEVSGATVAPDGRVILLLDVGGVLDLNLYTQRRESRAGDTG